MSYDVQLFDPSVRRRAENGEELDEFEHPSLNAPTVQTFEDRLLKRGYRLESSNSAVREYVKRFGDVPVQVGVYATEIAFSVPYWENSDRAIAEVLRDVLELNEAGHFAMYDPQREGWADG